MLFSISQALEQVESGKDEYWMLVSQKIGKSLADGLCDQQVDDWADRCMKWYGEQTSSSEQLKIVALMKVLAKHNQIEPPPELAKILRGITN